MNRNDEKHKFFDRLKVAAWCTSLVGSVALLGVWAHSMVGVS